MKFDPLYGTHLPILARILDLTDGPVLELGTGIFSTFLMDIMCKESKRKVVSYDNDPKWHESNMQWQSEYHDINLVTDWDSIEIETTHWSVVLVDHKPAKRRKEEIKRLANH